MNDFDKLSDIVYIGHNISQVNTIIKYNVGTILEEFPIFFRHLFGWYNGTKWLCIDPNISINSKYKLKFYPSGIFTKESIVVCIVDFLWTDTRMLNLFIIILIEECERNYWVDLLPSLILLSIIKDHSIDRNNIIHQIKNIYCKNASILDKIVASEVNINITSTLEECFSDMTILKTKIAEKIVANVEFQIKYCTWDMFTFTSEMCLFKSKALRWSQLVELQVASCGNKIKFLYQEGILGSETEVEMKSEINCANAKLILDAQLTALKMNYCDKSRLYSPQSCLKEHWSISRLLYNSSLLCSAILRKDDYHNPPDAESIGNNCFINIVNLKIPTVNIKHVCIKQLFKYDKSEEFWKVISIYRKWIHPNILLFYGFTDSKLGIFRECATSPLITYLVKGINLPFKFVDWLSVLSSIGSALHYLHDNLMQYHGNVTLQRIMKVDGGYKLCEPSLDKRVDIVHDCLHDLGENIESPGSNEQGHDLWQLIYSMVAIFYINDAMYQQKISKNSFEKTQCYTTMARLILKWLSKDHRLEQLMKDLYEASFSTHDKELILVHANNDLVPEFLRIVARDANMFEVINIDFKQLKSLEKIGKGNFSEVFRAEYHISENRKIPVAVKMIKDKGINSDMLLRELRPSTIVSHRNVLKSIGFSVDQDQMYVITELGLYSLQYHLGCKKDIKNEDCLNFCMQICAGMRFISDNMIIHRDLATRNVIVFRDIGGYLLKISDFGLTVLLKDKKDYYNSTDPAARKWIPPEDIETKKYSLKTDIYSFGVVMWEIFSRGKDPPEGTLNEPVDICAGGYSLIMKCRAKDADQRPKNFEEINRCLEGLGGQGDHG